MLKLMKYEWMNRWKIFLGGLTVCILLNIDIVSRIMNKNDYLSLYTGTLFLVVFVMGIVLAVDHIIRMYKSLFTEEGQLLFTTPLSGYKILGGKIANIILESLGIGVFAGIFWFVDYKVILNKVPELEMLSKLPPNFVLNIMKMLMLMLFGYITLILMIYLSMALAKSIFSAIKYGKLLSFLFFILISKVVGTITSWLGSFTDSSYLLANGIDFTIPNTSFLISIGMIAMVFIVTGYLLDRKINL
ncbi:hypothetical protein IZY60_06860 [Lutibacter sp. B2]|nr:hypothetical protein [Lutibacter sp. B2]